MHNHRGSYGTPQLPAIQIQELQTPRTMKRLTYIMAAAIVLAITITSCSTTTKNAAHYKKPYNNGACAAYH